MNREDWLDYFEATNGRTPSEQEVAQALSNGEFQDVTQSPNTTFVSPQFGETAQPASFNSTVAPAGQGGTTVNNFNVENIKTKGLNYFTWFTTNLKKPMENKNTSTLYTFITAIIASLLFGFAIVNVASKTFLMIFNINVNNQSIKSSALEDYNKIVHTLENHFGLSLILVISILILIAYVVMLYLPLIVRKIGNKQATVNFGKIEESVTPIMLVIGLFAVLVTFFIPSRIIVSDTNNPLSSLFGSFSGYGEGSISSIYTNLFESVNRIPELRTATIIYGLLLLSVAISFIALLINFIKQSNYKVKNTNSFYVTFISTIIVLIILYFINQTITNQIVNSLLRFLDDLSTLSRQY